MSAPIVFLDIDGVLVTPATVAKRLQKPLKGHKHGYHLFDPVAVDNLNRITNESGAVIVLSSTWRRIHWPGFREIAEMQGVMAPVIDRTPYLGTNRGHEIQTWLDDAAAYDGQPFVILDDEDDMGDLSSRLVQTEWSGPAPGLRTKHVVEALRLLEAS